MYLGVFGLLWSNVFNGVMDLKVFRVVCVLLCVWVSVFNGVVCVFFVVLSGCMV